MSGVMTMALCALADTFPCPCGCASASVVHVGNGQELLRCRQCSLLARAKMPTEEEAVSFYRDEYWVHFRMEQIGRGRTNVYVQALNWLTDLHPDADRSPPTFMAVAKEGSPSTAYVNQHTGIGMKVCQPVQSLHINVGPSSPYLLHPEMHQDLHDYLVDGKLRLSLHDAIVLALENNTRIRVQEASV